MADQPAPWWKRLSDKPYLLTAALFGLLLLVGGLIWLSLGSQSGENEGIELVTLEKETESILIDVGGAVENPGLYKLKPDSRINDALVAAGGLSAQADRTWVSQTLNLAAKVSDGDKIFIPSLGEKETSSSDSTDKKINLNTASLSQLDTLYGVGLATAQKIIDNRPYASVEELLSKKAVGQSVYEQVKGDVSVY